MSLVKQNFKHCNIKLSFYSFVEPLSSELWMSGNDIAQSLRFSIGAADAIQAFVHEDERIEWLDLPNVDFVKTQANWSESTLMISENGLYSLIAKSRYRHSSQFKSFIRGTVIEQCKKKIDGRFAHLLNLQEDVNILDLGDDDVVYGHFYMATTPKLMSQNVYVFGSTINLDYRLNQLQTKFNLPLQYSFSFNTRHYRVLEDFMLEKFKDFSGLTDFFFMTYTNDAMLKMCKIFVSVADRYT